MKSFALPNLVREQPDSQQEAAEDKDDGEDNDDSSVASQLDEHEALEQVEAAKASELEAAQMQRPSRKPRLVLVNENSSHSPPQLHSDPRLIREEQSTFVVLNELTIVDEPPHAESQQIDIID